MLLGRDALEKGDVMSNVFREVKRNDKSTSIRRRSLPVVSVIDEFVNQPDPNEQNRVEERKSWPYPTLLAHSIKVYPIVQVADRIGPQPADCWPPQIDLNLAAWQGRTTQNTLVQNQIYVHVPFCPFLCHFCPLYKVESGSERTRDQKEVYVQGVIDEIYRYGKNPLVTKTCFHAIYFGGGTPTELSPAQLKRILTALRSNFSIASDAEITLEGVAKQMLSPEYFETCEIHGFNRISFGVQSLDPRIRKRIGRGDHVEDYYALIELVRNLYPDFPINVEIMAGLPEQTYESFSKDVKQLIAWQTSSADILYYVMMPGTKLQRLVNQGKRGAPRYGTELLKMREFANRTFTAAGYQQVTGEVFVRSERDLFVNTSFGGSENRLNTVLALGPSAFGLLNGTVYHNICDLQKYLKTISQGLLPINTAQTLDPKTARRRALLLSVLQLEIPYNLIESFSEKRLFRKWEHLGLIERRENAYRLTEKGKLWYNHMQIDLLSIPDTIKSLRMLGSVEDQIKSISKRKTQNSSEQELLIMMRHSGRLGLLNFLVYRSYLRLLQLPFFDKRAVGFTGPLE
jgi:coproporphyrinogen III oxidase-like Fe-S oxidoreductase